MAGTSIALGLKQFIHAFTARRARNHGGRVEMFPFLPLTEQGDSPWKGIRRAMDVADAIYFNMQGMTKEREDNVLWRLRRRNRWAYRLAGFVLMGKGKSPT